MPPDAGRRFPPETDPAELLRRARQVRLRAYAPYSRFRVGAVVLTATGELFEGVNVENASYRLACCAEQSAIAAMATSGSRGPVMLVAVVGDGPDPCTPCGACRQTIFEFGPDAVVHAAGIGGPTLVMRITELLPEGFGPQRLSAGQADDPGFERPMTGDGSPS